MVKMNKYNWLLNGFPWVKYNTLIHLHRKSENTPEIESLREFIIESAKIKAITDELENWPGPPLKRHNDSSHLIHKLAFISDIGLKSSDAPIDKIIEKILVNQSDEGPFYILSNINPRYGGSGEDEFVWFLCDAPLVIYALARFGLSEDKNISKAIHSLVSYVRENGWPCTVSKELGKFRGPGRKDDPCPYATLLMIKALSQFPNYYDSKEVKLGIESLLNLWEERKVHRPYLFAMGTDFLKLKAPLIWYDILHILDVLSNFPYLRNDPRVIEMIEIVKLKETNDGRYIPESVFRPWKEWDFGQKKLPSEWLSFLVYRVLFRFGRIT